MGIYIKDMEMPEHCGYCRFRYDGICHVLQKTQYSREKDCPLISAPPHGRLIDAENIGLTDFEIVMCNGDYKEALKMILEKIEKAPAIIPPEK